MPAPLLASLGFTPLDWGVVLFYLAFTTLLGAKLAGKQATIRDFFLGGRRLPWYAVAGSIVATEISAVTFVSVPAIVYAPGGNLTYLQLGLIGALIARLIVAFVLVPAYYAREIYSPYDYMGHRLGVGVKRVMSALFTLGGILAQSARVYLTAIVLEVVLGSAFFAPVEEALGVSPTVQSIWIIGIVAVAWTLLGGITTVIWTDVILFCVFLLGAAVALLTVAHALDGGFAEIVRAGADAGKFRFFDFDADPTKAYTVWTAAFASVFGMVGIYGTDQLMAQRIFCCAGPREAKKAVVASWLGNLVTLVVMLVGIGLYAYYREHPLQGEAAELVAAKSDRIFPVFIVQVIPPGLTGLIIAGIFAAAISSLDSILAALGQTAVSTLWQPARRRRLGLGADDPFPADEERRQVRAGRLFIVLAGILLCVAAQGMIAVARSYQSILDLALAMAGYTSGALLAGFLLAFLPLPVNGRGLWYSAPLSVLGVYALVWHTDAAWIASLAGCAVLLAAWLAPVVAGGRRLDVGRLACLLGGCAVVLAVNRHGTFSREVGGVVREVAISWPWQAPFGFLIAFVLAVLLGDRRDATARTT